MAGTIEKRRVVVTGLGLVTPLGNDVNATWRNILNDKSGIRRISKWGDLDRIRVEYNLAEDFPLIAGEIRDFDINQVLKERRTDLTREDLKRVRQIDPFIEYACAASLEAVGDAGLGVPFKNKDKVGVAIGSGQGGIQTWEEQHRRMLTGKKLSPFFIPRQLANLASGNVSILLGAHGINICPSSACASGAYAIGQGFRAVGLGQNDIIIVGGTEAAVTPLNVSGFHALKALSTSNSEPWRASRPFDEHRDGFVMAEGAGVMVLEDLRHAQERGARIYAEIVGCGETADAYHVTDPNTEGAISCMRMALKDAGMTPGEIDLINPHATSTPKGDASEAKAIKEVFGSSRKGTLVTANKSQIGHPLGAAGAIEAALTVLSIYNDRVPPIANLEQPCEECKELNFVREKAMSAGINVAISNSSGFGGTNVSLVFRKFN